MSELKIKADTGAGTVSWKGPNATTSNAAIQLTLPVDDRAATTWLKSNGSGVTSWAAPTATEIATSSGTAGNTTFLRGDNTWAAIGATGKLLKWDYPFVKVLRLQLLTDLLVIKLKELSYLQKILLVVLLQVQL